MNDKEDIVWICIAIFTILSFASIIIFLWSLL